MTTRRAVTYGGLSCLLAAWLASAASTSWQQQPREPERSMVGPSTETLAADVQAHAARLRERLASAPVPQLPHRNPFVFESRQPPAPRQFARRVEPAVLPPPPSSPPEPTLTLIGIAEDKGPKGLTRTAMIADDAEALFMVTVGQTVMGRYRVEAVGADVVELKDVESGAIRRLALR